jgi:hypothetical protein
MLLGQWFASVGKGQLNELHVKLCNRYNSKFNFWQLSILNPDDLTDFSKETQQLLVSYTCTISHYHNPYLSLCNLLWLDCIDMCRRLVLSCRLV